MLLASLTTLAMAKELDITKAKGTDQSVISSLTPPTANMDVDQDVVLKVVFDVELELSSHPMGHAVTRGGPAGVAGGKDSRWKGRRKGPPGWDHPGSDFGMNPRRQDHAHLQGQSGQFGGLFAYHILAVGTAVTVKDGKNTFGGPHR